MTAQISNIDARSLRPIFVWLCIMCALVALMVTVGGATRLTDSGLSITEWKPIVGAVPPLSESHWLTEFEKYKQIPEYREVNAGMSMAAFKQIYWWEWGHRFLGRVIGLAFAVPFFIFVVTGRARGFLRWQLFGLLMLGGAQGALGWYMVKSGLTERVDVSQYRLAAHLGLAVFLFGLMAWLALRLRRSYTPLLPVNRVNESNSSSVHPPLSWRWALVLAIGVYAQMIFGAFVAGLRAGRTFNTWPLMGGEFFPDTYFMGGVRFAALFENLAAVQFNHRMAAYGLVFAAAVYAWRMRGSVLRVPAVLLLAAMTGQAVLGIITLLNFTPLGLGLLHQAGALFVFAVAIWLTERALATHHGLISSRSIEISGTAGLVPNPA